jgi:hypothetical protein
MVPERQSPELREIVSGNFRVVYRRKQALVEIVTVFRGSRNFSSLGCVMPPNMRWSRRGFFVP